MEEHLSHNCPEIKCPVIATKKNVITQTLFKIRKRRIKTEYQTLETHSRTQDLPQTCPIASPIPSQMLCNKLSFFRDKILIALSANN